MAARRDIGKAGWGQSALAFAVGMIYFFPVLWIILTAFKTSDRCARHSAEAVLHADARQLQGGVLPHERAPSGRAQATNFALYFFNSIFIAGTAVLLAVIIGTLAAYAFSAAIRCEATTPTCSSS